jgi:hypothetical protein
MQWEGEVQPCRDPWHERARKPIPALRHASQPDDQTIRVLTRKAQQIREQIDRDRYDGGSLGVAPPDTELLTAVDAAITALRASSVVEPNGDQRRRLDQIESAIGFLSAPDRERIIERLGYTDAEIASYFRTRNEASLPCLQPRGGA